MKKNLFYLIGIIGTAKILIDGFNGEFSNPSILDIAKWLCFIIYLILLLIYHRKEKQYGKR